MKPLIKISRGVEYGRPAFQNRREESERNTLHFRQRIQIRIYSLRKKTSRFKTQKVYQKKLFKSNVLKKVPLIMPACIMIILSLLNRKFAFFIVYLLICTTILCKTELWYGTRKPVHGNLQLNIIFIIIVGCMCCNLF